MTPVRTEGDFSITTDGSLHYLWFKEKHLVVKNTLGVCEARLLAELKKQAGNNS